MHMDACEPRENRVRGLIFVREYAMTTTQVGDKTRRAPNVARFFGEVRQEARKVTWTTRKETVITTIMVFIMVAIAAVFFFVVDMVLGVAIKALLSLSL